MNCPVCNNPYDSDKAKCPLCGTKNPELSLPEKPDDKKIIMLAGGIVLFVSCIVLFFFVIKPALSDRKTPKYYVITDVLNLRSSEYKDVSNSNVIKEIPFGTEVLVYQQNEDWAKVKVKKLKGYMGSPLLYLKDKKTFHEINAIFGNEEARAILKAARIKQALVDYYRKNSFFGNISEPVKAELSISYSPESVWQVMGLPAGVVYNILVSGFFMGNQEECDAVIIENKASGIRRLLIFSYLEDVPTFRFSIDVPQDYNGITKVSRSSKIFVGKIVNGKQVLERPMCDAIEFGSNDVFNVAKKSILIYTGTEFKLYLQP
jgi:hypothetical protein